MRFEKKINHIKSHNKQNNLAISFVDFIIIIADNNHWIFIIYPSWKYINSPLSLQLKLSTSAIIRDNLK